MICASVNAILARYLPHSSATKWEIFIVVTGFDTALLLLVNVVIAVILGRGNKPPPIASNHWEADCIGFEVPAKEPASLLRGCPIQPTITEYNRHNTACLFDGHKKTTFNSGLFLALVARASNPGLAVAGRGKHKLDSNGGQQFNNLRLSFCLCSIARTIPVSLLTSLPLPLIQYAIE